VACNIQGHRFLIDLRKVEIGDDKFFAVKDRFDNVACIGRDDGASRQAEL